jgi:hypothetical protein
VAVPQKGCQNDDQNRESQNSPGNDALTAFGVIAAGRADVFGARQMEFGQFLGPGRRDSAGLRVPHLLGIELRLAEADEVIGDGLVLV